PSCWLSEFERAMSRPSDDTATASVTPAASSTKLLSNQLKLRASFVSDIALLRFPVPLRVRVSQAALHAGRKASQESLDLGGIAAGPPAVGAGRRLARRAATV